MRLRILIAGLMLIGTTVSANNRIPNHDMPECWSKFRNYQNLAAETFSRAFMHQLHSMAEKPIDHSTEFRYREQNLLKSAEIIVNRALMVKFIFNWHSGKLHVRMDASHKNMDLGIIEVDLPGSKAKLTSSRGTTHWRWNNRNCFITVETLEVRHQFSYSENGILVMVNRESR